MLLEYIIENLSTKLSFIFTAIIHTNAHKNIILVLDGQHFSAHTPPICTYVATIIIFGNFVTKI